jgi:two-component sensor histidine kinase
MAHTKVPPPTAEQRIDFYTRASAPGIWDWDVYTGKLEVTPRLRVLFGLGDKEPVTLEKIIEVTQAGDHDWLAELQESQARAGAEPRPFRLRIAALGMHEPRWLSCSIVPHEKTGATGGKVISHTGIVHDITEQFETSHALLVSEERLRLAIEAGKMAVWEVDLETGTMTPSAELNMLCGFAPDAKPTLWDIRALYNRGELERLAVEGATVEAVRQRAVGGAFEPWTQGAFTSGADRTQVQAEVAITTPAGVPKHLMLRAQYALSWEGRPRLTGLLFDLTETKMAQEQLAVVAREMQHRVKNSLAVVGAIAAQSLRGRSDPDAALKAFLGRLHALSSATDLTLRRHFTEVALGELVEVIIKPYSDDQSAPFTLAGDDVTLPASYATSLGMVLHELCTNAVKYGSLSVPSGKVEIAWTIAGGTSVSLTWRERGGPPVAAPKNRGFGTKLFEQLVAAELNGSLKSSFAQEGFECEIQFTIIKQMRS